MPLAHPDARVASQRSSILRDVMNNIISRNRPDKKNDPGIIKTGPEQRF
jgi:hypothetical protein